MSQKVFRILTTLTIYYRKLEILSSKKFFAQIKLTDSRVRAKSGDSGLILLLSVAKALILTF